MDETNNKKGAKTMNVETLKAKLAAQESILADDIEYYGGQFHLGSLFTWTYNPETDTFE